MQQLILGIGYTVHHLMDDGAQLIWNIKLNYNSLPISKWFNDLGAYQICVSYAQDHFPQLALPPNKDTTVYLGGHRQHPISLIEFDTLIN
jgi:hypothetical protein